MRGLGDMMGGGPPPLNDSDGKWLVSFFKVIFYVGLISGGTWFLFTWNQKSVKVQTDVTWIKRAAVTRAEWERYINAENAERRRIWKAIHKPGEAQDIDPKSLRWEDPDQ